MNCETVDDRLMDLVAGSLDEVTTGQIEAHTTGCRRCQGEIAAYRETVRLLARVTNPEMSPGFWANQRLRIMQAIAATLPSRAWEAPPLYLAALICILLAYPLLSMDVLGGILADVAKGASRFTFDYTLTLVPIYAGMVALALFVVTERDDPLPEERLRPQDAG
ncbi:MAG: zf-HC2 domain-containing protein [Candidatus Riflebacteria bacterium]|nr:zf-HC2 domain-containing protein [Candidatus Riflebacteria bacterium]